MTISPACRVLAGELQVKRTLDLPPRLRWLKCIECDGIFGRDWAFRQQARLGLKTADDTATVDELICPYCEQRGTLRERD